MGNIFLIRSFIDLDYNMPLIVKLDNVELWLRNNIDYSIYKDELAHVKIVSLFNFKWIRKFKKFNLYYLKSNYIKNLRRCPKGSHFFIDHDFNIEIYFITKLIRKFSLYSKIILIPHGVHLFQNRILDYNMYDNNRIDISNIDYDFFISNDIHFESLYIFNLNSKNFFFPSWRYTINEVIKRYGNSQNNIYGNNILLYHTKRIGNVDWPNLVRSIKIINKHTRFNIFIKPHPRGGYVEAKELALEKTRNYILTGTVNQFNLNNYEYFIVISSSVILDLLLLKKKVIILSFVSGNVFHKEILDRCIVINTPEQLIDFCNTKIKDFNFEDISVGSDFDLDLFSNLLSINFYA